MANTVLTPSIIAQEALMILENECVMGNLVYRGYEEEFDKEINGYLPGNTINVRRPTDFTVRTGRTASVQDVTEGQFPIVVNSQIGVDFQFTSQDLTQNIKDLSERVIKPAVVQLANQIDRDLTGLYTGVYNWVGTPGTNISTFAGFAKGPERLDLLGTPGSNRKAVLSPTDYWAMAGGQTALYMQQIAGRAYKTGEIGEIAEISTFKSQNITTLSRGSALTGTVNSLFTTSYASTLNANTMSIALQFITSVSVAAGDVFTLSGVSAVNPVTKATQNYLQQFVVRDAAGGTGTVTLTITPPIITSGAFQTVSAAPTASSAATFAGGASTSYAQNMIFHKNAFALVVVPMIKPPGAVDVSRKSYKGYSVRVIPYYTGSNDISAWRLDMLYGVKCLDPRIATRISGT
jgi:hypothetical protein